jgi:hypothetical protein
MTSARLISTAARALLSVGTRAWTADAAAQATTVAPTTGHADAMMAGGMTGNEAACRPLRSREIPLAWSNRRPWSVHMSP